MSDIAAINQYILEQVKSGNMKEDMAFTLLKSINTSQDSVDDIAIIGVSCRFPQADNVEKFWNNILENKVSIRQFPDGRMKKLSRNVSDNDKSRYLTAGYLEDIDLFDPGFFGISINEAVAMLPQQRMFMEVAYEALEHAGYGGKRLDGKKTGIYVGIDHASNGNEYMSIFGRQDIIAKTGSWPGMLSSRIAYALNLKGPNMVIDTACSSGLVAIHTACSALRNKECGMAVAGGINILVYPKAANVMEEIEAEGADVRPFSRNASGTVWGEGVGALILKPLSKAISDNNRILGVIKGSAVNSNGKSNGITAPSASAQQEVIMQAWKTAQVEPESIQYIETHGTGTLIGDPIELKGITAAFRQFTKREQFCGIGCSKQNIGHCVAASGIASIIKMLKAMQERKMLSIHNFDEPNPFIRFIHSPVFVVDQVKDWKRGEYKRRAGVSSFGFTGTNCHVVLEEPPEVSDTEEKQGLHIFCLSARNEKVLHKLINQYVQSGIEKSEDTLENVCYTQNVGRGHYLVRLSFVVKNRDELISKLKLLQESSSYDGIEDIYYGTVKIMDHQEEAREVGGMTQFEHEKLTRRANQYIKEHAGGKDQLSDEYRKICQQICQYYVQGADIDWERVYYQNRKIRIADVPVYPFDNQHYWPEIKADGEDYKNQIAYHLAWKGLPKTEVRNIQDEKIVLIMDSQGVGENVKHALANGNKLITVVLGETFSKTGNTEYICSETKEDYEKLFHELAEERIDRIIHVSSITAGANGVRSVFQMYQALIGIDANKRILRLNVISSNAYEITGQEHTIEPDHAAVYGLLKAASRESGFLHFQCLDIDLDSYETEEVIRAIAMETPYFLTALRNRTCYVEEIEAGYPQKEMEVAIRENGVYLVTGGNGGIGKQIARYLASRKHCKIIFLSRTPFQDEELLKELEKSGSKYSTFCADVADYEQMELLMETIHKEYGVLHGVFHCAGLFEQGYLAGKDWETVYQVMKVKMEGTRILDQVTRDKNLDCLFLFSSMAAIIGMQGQAGYTAANSFLDSFQEYRNKSGFKTISVNWGIWGETGGALNFQFDKEFIYRPLTNQEALEVLEKILEGGFKRTLAVKINYQNRSLKDYQSLPLLVSKSICSYIEFLKTEEKEETENKVAELKNVIITGRKNGDYSEDEIRVAQVWGNVLGYREINIYEDFFSIGGDSRAAALIVNYLKQMFHMAVTAADVLKFPTIESFCSNLHAEENTVVIRPAAKKEQYALSYSQYRLFIMNQMAQSALSYNVPMVLSLNETIDEERMQKALVQMVERQEVFRTAIEIQDGEPKQVVKNEAEIRLEEFESKDEQIEECMLQFFRPFDLSKAPLLRAGIIKTNDRQVLLLDFNHIIADGTSIRIFLSELFSLYKGKPLDMLKLHMKDYTEWQNQAVKDGLFKQQEEYWMNQFANGIPKLELQEDYDSVQQGIRGERLSFVLEKELIESLKKVSAEYGVTLYMILASAFYLLLYKYTGQKELVLGIPVSGRNQKEQENMIGMFVNVLPVKVEIDPQQTYEQMLERVRTQFLNAYENQDYPYLLLLEKMSAKYGVSSLFEVSFLMQSAPMEKITVDDTLSVSLNQFNTKTAREKLLLEIVESGEEIAANFEYSDELYTRSTIEQLATYYQKLVRRINETQKKNVDDIELVTKAEQLLFQDFNDDLL